MKKQITLLAILLVAFTSIAQTGFNYKALITNNGNVLSNHNVSIKFTILQGSTSVYQEIQTTTTDTNGIVTVNIGEGTAVSGNFTTIDWATDTSLKVEMDTGSGYRNFGTSVFKSVPVAKYADKAGNVFSGSYNDLTNRPSVFSNLNGSIATNTNDNILHRGILRLGDYDGLRWEGQLVVENYDNVSGGQKVGATIVLNNYTGTPVTHYNIGLKTILRGTDNATQYGVLNYVENTGYYSQFGIYNRLSGTATGDIQGVYNGIDNVGDGIHYGAYSVLSGNGAGKQYGLYNKIENTGGEEHYGVYNEIIGNSTGIHYGVKNIVEAGTTTATQYGTYNSVTSNSTAMKYGTYNIIPDTAHGYGIAVYGRAENSTNDDKYAGYFKGRMYISDKTGLGTQNPTGRLQTIPLGNIYSSSGVNIANSGLLIGTDTEGMAFDSNQIERVGSGALHLNYSSSNDITLAHGGGKVGIGTANPAQLLHIKGNNASIKIETGSKYADFRRFTNRLLIETNDMIQFGTGGGLDFDMTLEHSGDLKLNHKLITPTTGSADMKATMFASVNADGTSFGSHNYQIIKNSLYAGIYKFNLTDQNFNTNDFVILVSIDDTGFGFARTVWVDNSHIEVQTFNTSGGRADRKFKIIAYKK